MSDEEPDENNCSIPPPLSIEAVSEFVLTQSAEEARDISEYVEGQARDESVVHCELVKTEFAIGAKYDVWDVHTDKNRWWVITNPTNLYSQAYFPSLDYTISFHIGLMARVGARSDGERDQESADMMTIFRKLEQIGSSLEAADEVEDFQSVGLQCREALVALSRALSATIEHVGADAPKAADFKNWADVAANSLAAGSSASASRAFLKAVAQKAWDLVSWLTHASNATRYDAVTALLATTSTIDAFAMMLKKHRSRAPNRCPSCSSYKLTSHYRPEFETDSGYIEVCPKCGWTNAPVVEIDGGEF